MQVIVLTFPQNKCFTEKTTCPLSGMLISLVGWGIGFFFLARKAAKICKRNLDWEVWRNKSLRKSFPARIYQPSGEKNLPHHIGQNFCQFSQLLLSFSSPEHSNVSPDP